jgi:riboflavin transporter FmnP
MHKKAQLKNILIGVLIGLIAIFMAGLIFYFVYLFPLYYGTIKLEKEMNKWEQRALERQKDPYIR